MLMVALNALLRELTRDVRGLRKDGGERRRVERRLISGRHRRRDLGTLNRLRQERRCRGCVTCGTDEDINHLAVLVDRSKGVVPATGNPDICLVDTPVVPHPTAMRTRRLLIQGRELLDAIDGGRRTDMDAAFG